MSYRLLDDQGKPIPKKGRSRRPPAVRIERGKELFHYQIIVSVKQPSGKFKNIVRHKWFPDDLAAEEFARSLKHQAPVSALSWGNAFEQWGGANGVSEGHRKNVAATLKRWLSAMGADKTIEDTSLPQFTGWTRERAKTGKGRGAQLDHAHLLAIARWAREQGLIKEIPFEHAPKPEDRMDVRQPAEGSAFYEVGEILPEHIRFIWTLMGWTGARIGGLCGLLEADITDATYTVTTKGSRRETYPITSEIGELIQKARAWKAERGFAGKPYLFCNQNGERWTSKSLGHRIARIIEAHNDDKSLAGHPDRRKVPKLTAHQLRHMAGTTLGENDHSIPTIMATLGHTKEASSLVYTKRTMKMRGEGIKTLIKNLSKSDPKNEVSEVFIDEETLSKIDEGLFLACPHCSRNLLMRIKKKAQP